MDGLSLLYGIIIGIGLPPVSLWVTAKIKDSI